MKYPDLTALQNEISVEFPDFRLRRKQDSLLMKFIGWLLLVVSFGKNKDFMKEFATTINKTVYLPTDWDKWSSAMKCMLLRHERVHMRQARKYTFPLFAFLYFFFPLPVVWTWRAKFEREAYEETIRALIEYGDDPSHLLFRITVVRFFTSSAYLWMWTDREAVENWLNAAISKAMGAHKN